MDVVSLFGRSFVGVYRLGDFSHTHSVRKLTASWLIIFCARIPPTIGLNRTLRWVVVAGLVNFLGDPRGLVAGGVGVVGGSTCLRFSVLTIWGVLPGMLCRVRRECVLAVIFNFCGAVGLGAVMIGGASVMRVIGCATLCFSAFISTLCSTVGAGGTMDNVECPLWEASIGGWGR